MPTRPIPAGTVNFPVNMPTGFRQRLGRFAYLCQAPSIGAFVREALRKVMRFPHARRLASVGYIADGKAVSELMAALADGRIDHEDTARVQAALAHAKRSERVDRILYRFFNIGGR